MKARTWCFTHYPEEGCLTKFLEAPLRRYCIVGEETCPKTGKQHYQGYIEFHTSVRLASLKSLDNSTHWEARKGTREQAREYCMKEGKFHESGDWESKQGKRNDLSQAKELAMKEGIGAVAEQYNLQVIRTCEKLLSFKEASRTWKPTVYWLYGKTGTGKSKYAFELAEGKTTYVKSAGNKWWDGYDKQEVVIIDDFRAHWWTFEEVLHLLDRYEHRLEFKGGMRQFLAKTIIITTCYEPEKTFRDNTDERIDQVERRLDHVIEFINVNVKRYIKGAPEVGGNTNPDK